MLFGALTTDLCAVSTDCHGLFSVLIGPFLFGGLAPCSLLVGLLAGLFVIGGPLLACFGLSSWRAITDYPSLATQFYTPTL